MTTPNANGVNQPTNGLHFAGLLHSAEENNMNQHTHTPYGSDEWPADTAIEHAQENLGRLQCLPCVAVCMADPDDHHDHLRTLQHWFGRGYFMSEESILERDDGSYRGVLLHRPSDQHVRL